MNTMIKMAIMTFLFKSSFSWRNTALMSIKDICTVDLISGIDNERMDDEIIRYIIPGGDFRIEYSLVHNRKVIQVWMPVQILETPEHHFSCIAN